jgi:hypothetical protein
MNELKDLKKIRDATWTRIKDTEDYILATHLDVVIPSLEKALTEKESHDDGPVDQESQLETAY